MLHKIGQNRSPIAGTSVTARRIHAEGASLSKLPLFLSGSRIGCIRNTHQPRSQRGDDTLA
jgi:hypothetical protein